MFDAKNEAVDILYRHANPAAIRLAGRDFTGQRMRDIDARYEEYWYETYGRVALTGESVRAEHYAEPHGRWFEFRLSRIGEPGSRLVASLFQDITERKRSEAALRQSETKFRAMREIAPDHEQHWFDRYGQVALTGRTERFEATAKALGDRYYEVQAFRVGEPEQRRVAIVFSDVTQRRKDLAALRASEERTRRQNEALQLAAHGAPTSSR